MQDNSHKLKIIFCGMPDMATVCLHAVCQAGFDVAAVIPPPNSNPTARGFIDFAKNLGLEVFEYDGNPNNPDMIEKIAQKKADIGLICSFNNLLKKDFLNTARLGYINCHPSLLPNYRGANPYFHIIKNGEKTSGVTLHFADEHFDTGDIIIQKGIILDEKETIGTLFNRTNFIAAELIVKVLKDLEINGKLEAKKQFEGNFIKAHKVPNEIRIDLNQKADEIERLVRASNPFYSTFLFFRGAPLKIFTLDYKKASHDIEIGTITKADNSTLEIAVSDGFIYPKCLQSGSWGVFDIETFIRVFKPRIGEIFK